LLHDLAIARPNQVWCSDITYITMQRGFLYLVAIMEWHSRRVLSWRLSNTMDVACCTEALQEALARHGRAESFNTDQGGQFTSLSFTQMLTDANVRIGMDAVCRAALASNAGGCRSSRRPQPRLCDVPALCGWRMD